MAKITVKENVCKGCELCVYACPKHIISLKYGSINEKGYHPAFVEEMEKCTGCAACAIMCPDCAITVER